MKLFIKTKTKSLILLFFALLFPLSVYAEEGSLSSNGCGPASIIELKLSCAKVPEWLLSAETEEEIVSIDVDGEVIWYVGSWKNGTWESGTWKNGVWETGTWKKSPLSNIWETGVWKSGIWEGGTWESGTWKDGIWKDGDWESGTWKGIFKESDFDPKTEG